MSRLKLTVVGARPAELDLTPARQVVAAINRLQPEWLRRDGIINLKLVDDVHIRALNKEYSGNDYATDVLSFNYSEGQRQPIDGELGDMIISLDTAARQAAGAGWDLASEVALLTLHGVLHILGQDHATPRAAATMGQIQTQVLGAAGLPTREISWDL